MFGDLQKAFPRTWRESLLVRLRDTVGLADGVYALLASIMELDSVHVNYNGVQVVDITQGIAEGGTIGPLTHPVHMDSLAEMLLAAGCGVGIGASTPPPPGRSIGGKAQAHLPVGQRRSFYRL